MRHQPKMTGAKTIFITGAGKGIGAATATLFAKQGWRVGLYDRDKALVEQLAGTLGENTHAGVLDVANISQWQYALSDFFDWAGRLDVLLNNAGILYSGAFENTPIHDHHHLFNVNVLGLMTGCHAALPYLKQTAGSRVINLSSASAIYGQADLTSYSASKFAVRGFTEALDIEWQRHGIRVMDIMPMFVNTDMVTNMNAKSIKKLGVALTATDVAQVIWQATTSPARSAKTHWTVGLQAWMMFKAAGLTPDWLLQRINSRIANHN